jgi:hypothetical protein
MKTLPENHEGFYRFSYPWLFFILWLRYCWTLLRPRKTLSLPRAANSHGITAGAGIRGAPICWRTPRGKAAWASAILGLVMAFSGSAFGQQQPSSKIPKLGKILGGSLEGAFSGKVQSVDTKLKVLNLKAAEGTGTEIFPLKKNLDIQTLNGEKKALRDLKPGSDVMIYYQLKGNERTIKRIVVLSQKPKETKKKSAPPS